MYFPLQLLYSTLGLVDFAERVSLTLHFILVFSCFHFVQNLVTVTNRLHLGLNKDFERHAFRPTVVNKLNNLLNNFVPPLMVSNKQYYTNKTPILSQGNLFTIKAS